MKLNRYEEIFDYFNFNDLNDENLIFAKKRDE